MSILSNKKVIVSMSGGVDSSVSAWLIKKMGYQVEGLFMKNWEEDDNDDYCASSNDLEDAMKVCNQIGIKLHTVNFSVEYWNNVFEDFLLNYKNGFTPNPDILCNKEIKFKFFLNFAIKKLNGDYIATGHHVRCINLKNKLRLFKGIDSNKDQSYFLHLLSNNQLSRCLFPVGNIYKTTVRHIANKLNFVTANKKSSTGICFIGKRKFRIFLEKYLIKDPGDIISINGLKLGRHLGLMYYTIGQRKGLGIGGTNKSNSYLPWYVVDKNKKNNLLIVAQGRNHPRLKSRWFIINKLHWINQINIKKSFRCSVKTRYQHPIVACVIVPIDNNYYKVFLDRPVIAIAPGQYAVFYMLDECLGGGVIVTCQSLSFNKVI